MTLKTGAAKRALAGWRPALDSNWTPKADFEVFGLCNSLRNLVGPPGFEPGTSCTPSKRASQAAPRPEITSLSQRQTSNRIRPNILDPARQTACAPGVEQCIEQ